MVCDPGGRGKGVSPYMCCTGCATVKVIQIRYQAVQSDLGREQSTTLQKIDLSWIMIFVLGFWKTANLNSLQLKAYRPELFLKIRTSRIWRDFALCRIKQNSTSMNSVVVRLRLLGSHTSSRFVITNKLQIKLLIIMKAFFKSTVQGTAKITKEVS